MTDLEVLEAIQKGSFVLKLMKLRALGFIEGRIPKTLAITEDGRKEIEYLKSRAEVR